MNWKRIEFIENNIKYVSKIKELIWFEEIGMIKYIRMMI